MLVWGGESSLFSLVAEGGEYAPGRNFGTDQDGDGICSSIDNCPSVYNPGQENSDGVGGGDACTLVVTFPLTPADVSCSAAPPTITWTPDIYNRFKVYLATSPAFAMKESRSSGDRLLKTTSWRVPARTWARTCALAHPDIFIKVLGKVAGARKPDFSQVVSIKVK
jgi:hypothetical protein